MNSVRYVLVLARYENREVVIMSNELSDELSLLMLILIAIAVGALIIILILEWWISK